MPTVTANGNNTFSVPASVTVNQPVTFMNVSGQANRTSVEDMIRCYLPPLQEAALSIRAALP